MIPFHLPSSLPSLQNVSQIPNTLFRRLHEQRGKEAQDLKEYTMLSKTAAFSSPPQEP